MNCDEIDDDKKRMLKAEYDQLNSFVLKRSIEAVQAKLEKLVHEKRKGSTIDVHNNLKPVFA